MSTRVLNVEPGVLEEYDEWMKGSQHGDSIIYWIGDLQFDRGVTIAENDLLRDGQRKQISSLNALANRIWSDAKLKRLILTQRRIGESVFEYRATRRRDDEAESNRGVQHADAVV